MGVLDGSTVISGLAETISGSLQGAGTVYFSNAHTVDLIFPEQCSEACAPYPFREFCGRMIFTSLSRPTIHALPRLGTIDCRVSEITFAKAGAVKYFMIGESTGVVHIAAENIVIMHFINSKATVHNPAITFDFGSTPSTDCLYSACRLVKNDALHTFTIKNVVDRDIRFVLRRGTKRTSVVFSDSTPKAAII